MWGGGGGGGGTFQQQTRQTDRLFLMSSSPSSISDTVTLSRGCTEVHSFLLDPGSSRFSIKDEEGGDSLKSRARRIKQLNGNISHSFAQQHISY